MNARTMLLLLMLCVPNACNGQDSLETLLEGRAGIIIEGFRPIESEFAVAFFVDDWLAISSGARPFTFNQINVSSTGGHLTPVSGTVPFTFPLANSERNVALVATPDLLELNGTLVTGVRYDGPGLGDLRISIKDPSFCWHPGFVDVSVSIPESSSSAMFVVGFTMLLSARRRRTF